jgi:pimeloyl-ACP methyl ester carboxylesterase
MTSVSVTSVSTATATTEDGCRLHYESAGRGPCVMLAPGLGGVGSFWAPVRDRLSASFRVLTFDHRGCGRSDRPEQTYTVERMAADVLAILDHAGGDRADIVGHSTGGAMGILIETDDRAGRANQLAGQHRDVAGAAAHIENPHAPRDAHASQQALGDSLEDRRLVD